MPDQNYSDENIVNFLNSFEVKATIQDLRQLKPEFVQKVFCEFLLDFGASLDTMNQLPLDVCESIRHHPHVYASVGRMMVLARAISDFLKHISRDLEFVPADLFDPKPKRTRRFFTHLIDFYFCAKEHIGNLNNIEEKAKIRLVAKEEYLENIAKGEEKIRQLKLENEENQIREEQMLKRIAEVKGEIQEVQGNKVHLKTNFDQIKMDIASFITNIKAAEVELIEKKELVERLASQVVQDSERLEIEERESRLATHRSDNDMIAENLTTLKQTLQSTKSATELINNELLPVLQEIEQEMTNIKEHNSAIAQVERTQRASLDEIEDCSMKIVQVNEVLVSRQEKISQMHMAWKLKKDSLQGELDQYKSTLVEIMRNQTEDEIVAQELVKDHMNIVHAVQKFKEQISQFDLLIASNYQKILHSLERHNTEVQTGLAALVQVANKKTL